ncbi:hypothetical protein ACFCWG_37510 [Streptomyces sp. NPDC056390]|uniref:hypothetical protein n=1 Tax=Streptomyces sp. NPDC056390 TaxID=3345806 RepID=UPI0035E2AD4F
MSENAWPWIETAKYRPARRGRHRSPSTVDLLVCATTAHHGLVVLHDDKDRAAAAGLPADLDERSVHRTPN